MQPLIVYTSVGGNTELVAHKIHDVLVSSGINAILKRAEQTTEQDITDASVVVLASPTYNQGTLESQFEVFMNSYAHLLSGKNCAIVGLGDLRYYPEYLTQSVTILEEKVTQIGGILIVPPLRIASNPLRLLGSLVQNWSLKLAEKIKIL